MAEISRVKQKIFAKNAVATDLGVVGSKSTGTPDYSTDVATLQSLTQFETGLRAMVSSTDAPYLQDQNSLFYIITSQLAYLFQAGVPAWEAATEYFAYKSLVTYNGKIYVAVQNSTNQNPSTEASYWIEYNELFIKYLPTTYNADVATAIGGYPSGAVLDYFDGNNVIKIISLVENNTNEPNGVNIKYANSGAGTYYWECITLDTGLKNLSDGLERAVCTEPATTTSTATIQRPAVIVENYYDSTTGNWCRVYSDGWCEQGGYGVLGVSNTASFVATFLKPFIDTNYTVYLGSYGAGSGTSPTVGEGSKTKTDMTVYKSAYASNLNCTGSYWEAKGYCVGGARTTLLDLTSIGNGASIVNEQFSYTFSDDAVLSIQLGGAHSSGNGGELRSTISVTSGDVLKAYSINGYNGTGGIGVGIKLNDTPILYAGGSCTGYTGGSGYEAGLKSGGVSGNTGYDYNGQQVLTFNDWSLATGTACGYAYHTSNGTANGGNGYVASAYTADTTTSNATNTSGAYIRIYQYL